jgi:glutathione peroxidase-family protein
VKQAHEKYAKDGFVVLGFNSDDTEKKMNDYIAEKSYGWRQYFMGDATKDLQKKYWVSGYPTNFLVGRDGKIITRSMRLGHGNARQLIEKALAEGGDADGAKRDG